MAAGLAVAAVGASVLYDRYGRGTGRTNVSDEADASADLATGRGQSQGPVAVSSLDAGYEVEDTNVRGIVIVMAVAVALMILGVAAIFHMYAGFDRHFAAASSGLTVEQREAIIPPLPHLQAFPYRDIDALLTEQRQRIDSYGWSDPAHRQAHIPIAQAMRLVVGKSLDTPAAVDGNTAPISSVLPAKRDVPPQAKPANHVQGEGRAGAIAPTYQPSPSETKP